MKRHTGTYRHKNTKLNIKKNHGLNPRMQERPGKKERKQIQKKKKQTKNTTNETEIRPQPNLLPSSSSTSSSTPPTSPQPSSSFLPHSRVSQTKTCLRSGLAFGLKARSREIPTFVMTGGAGFETASFLMRDGVFGALGTATADSSSIIRTCSSRTD